MSPAMPATVVIPAHDEERVLGRTLDALLEGLAGDVQVVVVCNGCTDATAEVARRRGPRVEVLEIEQASKVAALNAGDAAARGFPRAYLDADVAISGESMGRVLAALGSDGALAAEPRPVLDTSRSSPLVRAYYAVWLALHGARPGDVGCGLYALSERGRRRFAEFPRVIADDGYVRAHFGPGEIEHVADARSTVVAPRSLAGLVAIKTRSRLGALELAREYPELWARKRSGGDGLRAKLAGLPWRLWPLVPVYLLVALRVRVRARAAARDVGAYRWERDDSSR